MASAASACHALGMPLVIEPVVYRWSTESAPTMRRPLPRPWSSARSPGSEPLGADLLKLPFPVLDLAATDEPAAAGGLPGDSPTACARHALGAARVPGSSIDIFVEQIRLAGPAGASGFLAGRGIWGSALSRDPVEAERLAREVALPAFERCRAVAERFARPLKPAGAG